MNLTELEKKIINYDKLYREGNSPITDFEFDKLKEQLSIEKPKSFIFSRISFEEITGERMEPIPFRMASMNKNHTIEEIESWYKSKDIPINTLLVLSPKYDGGSLLNDESTTKCWTRGDGFEGKRSDEHFSMFDNPNKFGKRIHTIGEMIIPKKVFEIEFADTNYANPRNTISGLIGNDTPSKVEKYINCIRFIRYGIIGNEHIENTYTKVQQFEFLNNHQKHKVDFMVCTLKDLSEDKLLKIYTDWSKEYEIDGIIIEVNDPQLRKRIGYETSTHNPGYARAYKGNFEETSQTKVLNIKWQISQYGKLKPVMEVEPTMLNGAVVSNVTGNNAKFLRINDIGVDSLITIKRSGMVIPKVVRVDLATGFEIPTEFGKLEWDETETELMVTEATHEQKIKKLISFFVNIGAEQIGPGNCEILYDAGFDTPEKIINMSVSDFMTLDRFGESKSRNVYDAIQLAIKDITLSKFQHATGMFTPLGAKKLELLEHFATKPSVSEVMEIQGFSDKTAQVYVENYDAFFEYAKQFTINFTVTKQESFSIEGPLNGQSFVFTGFRDKEMEEQIAKLGGSIGSGVSSKTSGLVMKETGSGSSKEKKAEQLGVKLYSVNQFSEFLNQL